MSITTILGGWVAGSLLLGLFLGYLFRAFARRGRAEEDLFRSLHDMQAMAELRRRASQCKAGLEGSARLEDLVRVATWTSLPAQDEIVASFRLLATRWGRMIQ